MSKVTTGIGREGFVNGLFWRKLQVPRDRVDGGAEAPRPASRGNIIIATPLPPRKSAPCDSGPAGGEAQQTEPASWEQNVHIANYFDITNRKPLQHRRIGL